MVRAKVYKLVNHFKNSSKQILKNQQASVIHKSYPEPTDLKLVEEELPPLKDGEFLTEALYLSVDPYMRMAPESIPLGSTMVGEQVARILESKNPKFPVGKLVVGTFGWRTHTVSDGKVSDVNRVKKTPHLLPALDNLPPSLGLGTLGMPGNTAYFGLLDITRPKAGETLVVSGAAGAVGNVVCQIGKIKGCKVIGIAGSEDKGRWLTKELGLDHAINYKTSDVDDELSRLAPNGVDCYYDNVGGKLTTTIMKHMNQYGRVTIVGMVSRYNYEIQQDYSLDSFIIQKNQIRVEGFRFNSILNKYDEGIDQMHQWIREGKLKYRETITYGFENMFNAFINMLKGSNIGKAIVKV